MCSRRLAEVIFDLDATNRLKGREVPARELRDLEHDRIVPNSTPETEPTSKSPVFALPTR